MQAYDQLTHKGKLLRLRRLAEGGLAHYGYSSARLTLLNNVDTPVFRVDVPPSLAVPRHRRFVLRIHDPARQSKELLRSELQWLTALRHDTELIVPDPVPNQAGELVTKVSSEDVPGSRYLVIVSWLDGEFRKARLGAREFEVVGTFMARLHQHAQTFEPPQGFVRPTYDLEWMFGASSVLNPGKGERVFSAGDLAVFQAVAEHISPQILRLGKGRDVFGLTHADLHQNNYFFHKGEVRAIDFQDCAWGYYLFDIALTLAEGEKRKNLDPKDWAQQQAAFFAGYQKVLPLPTDYQEYIETFKIIRVIDLVNWVMSWPRLDLKPWGPRYLKHSVTLLQAFLDQETV